MNCFFNDIFFQGGPRDRDPPGMPGRNPGNYLKHHAYLQFYITIFLFKIRFLLFKKEMKYFYFVNYFIEY